MPATSLAPAQLRLCLDPARLGFASTAELQGLPVPWIGQERAQAAAEFGLGLQQPDYHLFVLGEVGSGRTSLLRQAMQAAAQTRPVPPDVCYLHDFDTPERPRALRLPAGQGRALRQGMEQFTRSLQTELPKRLEGADFRAEAERIEKNYQTEESAAFAALDALAEGLHFRLTRDNGHMVFTLLGAKGHPLTEKEAQALPRERRAEIDAAEQQLRQAIAQFLEATRPLERTRDQALEQLRRHTAQPLLAQSLQTLRDSLQTATEPDQLRLAQWWQQLEKQVLDHLALFSPAGDASNESAEDERKDELEQLLARCHINLVVDNAGLSCAPVIIEDNPQARSLLGSIEYQAQDDMLLADFSCIHAGSLLRAHGGFLLLHLRDLLEDEGLWERLRRFLRCNRLQIEEPAASAHGPLATVALQPEALPIEVKIVLIGSVDEYYALQEADPEVARRFRVKVDFAESFRATEQTRHNTAVFVAHTVRKRGLPHFSAAAVARLLEQSHREADDQTRQSALFAQTEALVIESAAQCSARQADLVEPCDIEAALQARKLRHNYPEQRLHESIADGERLLSVSGSHIGQINALTQIDLGDYRFGFPVRITARVFAGHEGLLNIEREVEMSGPIHDKGVLILHSYLMALFGHIAPLALNASIVFEQEYSGVEGDSASCAELYTLLSALSGLPLAQGIAVTGALNQHGEVLPVGGINEKIEGWFYTCQAAGLDGQQGVLIPARNRHHLMLEPQVVQAVTEGRFHIYTANHVRDGIALLTGQAPGIEAGETASAAPGSVIALAEQTLRRFRRACQSAARVRPTRQRP
ncbi:MAG: ATP-binding protein [Giesbergeria sp.]|uniref:Lon protease family protein n=1 Tax=Giesbergeria sp. TaxID=2818473 RepID=UPI0026134AEE|nr:ATP-binding protein [Giesbergeria sp.]MDD2609560.1 ATP-binding protein [Giesbergeria sp.]